jgi:hypothetical protein
MHRSNPFAELCASCVTKTRISKAKISCANYMLSLRSHLVPRLRSLLFAPTFLLSVGQGSPVPILQPPWHPTPSWRKSLISSQSRRSLWNRRHLRRARSLPSPNCCTGTSCPLPPDHAWLICRQANPCSLHLVPSLHPAPSLQQMAFLLRTSSSRVKAQCLRLRGVDGYGNT